MPDAILLQDWITVQGAGSTDPVTQSASGYQDFGGYADIILYLDVSDYSGSSPRVYYQTAPTKDEDTFQTLGSTVVSATGLTQTINRYASASVPLARWVRWNVSAGSAFQMTFRLWAVARRGCSGPPLRLSWSP